MTGAVVIGAGLAGCEAAWALVRQGIPVTLWEMKPRKLSPAHSYPGFAELVCSNSLKAMRLESAAGLLKAEMHRLGSLVLEAADAAQVPAGGALAVDREAFSEYITQKISAHPLIKIVQDEATIIPQGYGIIATGPLTSEAFSQAIAQLIGGQYLSFFDAAAPIVEQASLDMEKVFFAARYDRGGADYINCPFTKEEYEAFYQALVTAETAPLHGFDQAALRVYEGCMPIEVMAKRGPDTLRFGPLRPVGLRHPVTGKRPWANLQLRKENNAGSLYNLVGFQTNLKFGEQQRVFSMIPGLENASFVRYGVMHRNTFINSPQLLCPDFSLRGRQGLYFAGQITGVEGYIESAATGILVGHNLARHMRGLPPLVLPPTTMLGALCAYATDASVTNFQPMGSNMGLLPPLPQEIRGKEQRYAALAHRALEYLDTTLQREGFVC